LSALYRVMATGRGRSIATTAALLAFALSVCAAPASANVGDKIIEKCMSGEPFSGYTPADYREALKRMETGSLEYSECGALIRKAELASAGGGTGTSAGTAASKVALALTPAEQKAVRKAHDSHAPPVKVGNEPVVPGVVHANIASAINTLPHSLFALLAFLLAGTLVLAAGEVRKRVNARRNR
jgi:hypothetical protein